MHGGGVAGTRADVLEGAARDGRLHACAGGRPICGADHPAPCLLHAQRPLGGFRYTLVSGNAMTVAVFYSHCTQVY